MSRYHFNLTFFKRFWKLLAIVFPGWRSVTVLLFVLLLCMTLLEQFMAYQVGLIPSKYYLVLGNKDQDGFKKLTIRAVLIVSAMAFVVATKKYVISIFYAMSRKYITSHLHVGYFKDIVFYALNVLDESVDNPDQRITQDVERVCRIFSSIIADLMISPFTIAYYTYKTWSSTGYIGPVCVFAFFVISTIINKFLMSPVVSLIFRQEQLEGDFRFKHMQIRSNCESAAFYRCGNLELLNTNEKLDRLISLQHRLNFRQYNLQFSVNMADYFGSILSYIILAIPIFAGVYDDLSPSELSALISQNAFVTIYLIYCFTRLIDMAVQVSDIAGTTHRVVQLEEKLSSFGKSSSFGIADASISRGTVIGRSYQQSSESDQPSSFEALRVYNLSYSAPNSDHKLLMKNLSFHLQAGVNILVTGDSGCGKSSLLRVLDGIWPHTKGSISRNITRGYQGLLILPQKPYLTDGTLRQQIMFPYSLESLTVNRDSWIEDSRLIDYIHEAGLDSLYERTGGLDCPVTWNWYDMLSPGEMQRLSFVRLFFHEPPFAFLDEASSQIGLAMEEKLYTKCRQLNITLLSVGHRSSLRQFHQQELRFESAGTGKWCLIPILDGAGAGDSTDAVRDIRL